MYRNRLSRTLRHRPTDTLTGLQSTQVLEEFLLVGRNENSLPFEECRHHASKRFVVWPRDYRTTDKRGLDDIVPSKRHQRAPDIHRVSKSHELRQITNTVDNEHLAVFGIREQVCTITTSLAVTATMTVTNTVTVTTLMTIAVPSETTTSHEVAPETATQAMLLDHTGHVAGSLDTTRRDHETTRHIATVNGAERPQHWLLFTGMRTRGNKSPTTT